MTPALINKRVAIKLMTGIALIAGGGSVLTACSEGPPGFKSVDLTGADYAKDFALTDHNGQPRRLQDFQGKIVVVFFGFTQCPDACPTTMAELAQVKKLLGSQGEKLQVIFVSVDPQRDSQPLLKAYMANFDPAFLALRPTPEQLAAMAKDFKIYYKKVEGTTPDSYSMDHSAGSYIFDTQGRIRLFSRYGAGAEAVAADIGLLLKNSGKS